MVSARAIKHVRLVLSPLTLTLTLTVTVTVTVTVIVTLTLTLILTLTLTRCASSPPSLRESAPSRGKPNPNLNPNPNWISIEANDPSQPAADIRSVHVAVGRESGKPEPIALELRRAYESILLEDADEGT